jgi:hypothetical protein
MYKNSQTANNVFHLTLFNQEVKLPVSVRVMMVLHMDRNR